MANASYEMVIGLEVHVELKTKTKIFCSCSTAFGAEPNTQVCPVCLGMPGSLPVLNKKVVELAVKAGIATGCEITNHSKQDRKNYFYPDLPKAYQISQFDLPLCHDGKITIHTEDGEKKDIRIERIHIEEDAGKLSHGGDNGSLVDLNRGGIPLIEIVSKPDIRSAKEASEYVQKLRSILVYAGVSDAKMNEGQLRCDVNLSIREKGSEKLGTRTEMKNINSFNFIEKAINYEFKRQVELVSKGEKVVQETRRYDAEKNKTYSMRNKEDAQDYRYFPDPDLAPIFTSNEIIEEYRKNMPQLPERRKVIYMEKYSLSEHDADKIVEEKEVADYFEKVVSHGAEAKTACNLILGEIFSLLNKDSADIIKISPDSLANVVKRIEEDIISNSMAKKLLEILWNSKEELDVDEIIEKEDLKQITDENLLKDLLKKAIDANPKAVENYKEGKDKALQAIIGDVMRQTKGKASPSLTNDILMDMVK